MPNRTDAIIERTRANHSAQRLDAAEEPGRVGDPGAVAALADALLDSRDRVSLAAVHSLSRIDGHEATEALCRGLDAEPYVVREAAAVALGERGDTEAVRQLVGRLTDPHAGVRRVAAEALGKLEDPEALPGLLEAMADADPDVRKAAERSLRALVAVDHPDTVSELLGGLRHPAARVRLIAAEHLGRLGAREASGPLTDLLNNRSEADGVREAAATALGRIRDPRAVSALIREAKDGNAMLRAAVVQALVDMGPAATQGLYDALMIPRTRRLAARVFKAMRESRGLE